VIQQAKLYTPGAFSGRVTDPTSTLAGVTRASLPGTTTATLGGVVI
jgi:hypothetical protein